MVLPFNVKKCLALIVIVSVLAGCKTSPEAEDGENSESINTTVSANSESANAALTVSEPDPETLDS